MLEAVTSCCSLSIELLPKFGWSIRGEPIYGPGSVFQGIVCISTGQRIDTNYIRLQFHAVEAMHAIEISPGVLRAKKTQTLFAIQQTLWEGESLEPSRRTFPFTIQMPGVQYPPSIEHEYYQCTFKLTAYIMHSSRVLQSVEKQVSYQPFIETCLLKKPIRSPDSQFAFHALDYVPGDTITATLSAELSSSSEQRKRIITAKLYQTVMLHAVDGVPNLTKVVAAKRWDEDNVGDQGLLGKELKLDILQIPIDVIPSFSYSNIITVSYQVKVAVKQKKLGGFWNVKQQEFEFPIKIGTLGYGVHAPTQLRIYSTLSAEEQREETPRFMRYIEYSDALPLYDSTRLPTYEKVIVD